MISIWFQIKWIIVNRYCMMRLNCISRYFLEKKVTKTQTFSRYNSISNNIGNGIINHSNDLKGKKIVVMWWCSAFIGKTHMHFWYPICVSNSRNKQHIFVDVINNSSLHKICSKSDTFGNDIAFKNISQIICSKSNDISECILFNKYH